VVQLSLILMEIRFIDQYPMMLRLRTLAMAAEMMSRLFISRLNLSAATLSLERATRYPHSRWRGCATLLDIPSQHVVSSGSRGVPGRVPKSVLALSYLTC
jgi:hypothetical protein